MVNPIVNSTAYKVIKKDKEEGKLSHAYLIVCQDAAMLDSYMVEFAKLIAESGSFDDIRACMLIEKKMHPDVSFYPNGKKLNVANADEIVANSIIKPLELDKRIFVLEKIEDLAQYQNKLLKTIEEPPKNVHLLMGTVRENAVLSTVKSRSKKLTIPLFSEKELMEALKDQCDDKERLKLAVSLSGGKLGEALRYYEMPEAAELFNYSVSVMKDMNKASDILPFASKMKGYKAEDVVSAIKLVCGKIINDEKFCVENGIMIRVAVVTAVVERLNKIERSLNFNANATMVIDGILFAVMEEKARWQRLSV